MKSILNFSLALIIVSITLSSCSNQEDTTYNETLNADTETIQKLIDGIDKTYQYSQTQRTSSKETDLNDFFINTINESGIQIISTTNSNIIKTDSGNVSEEFEEFELLIADTPSYLSEDDYLSSLILLDESVRESELTEMEKQTLINKIAFMSAFVNWLDSMNAQNSNKSSFSSKVGDCDGWWSCWGKCTAAVLGATGTGALAGAVVPAAGCTLIVPVIGTVACGTVGGISGALTALGTADAC